LDNSKQLEEKRINVIITGTTGMVGSGVLIECLGSQSVEKVLVVGRRSCGVKHEKLTETIHQDFLDFSTIEHQFRGYDACFYCLGVTSLRATEAEYTLVTFDYTIKFAEACLRQSPGMTFCYVSGAGVDSVNQKGLMWVRVKGKTERHLLDMQFKRAYCFRPAFIQPLKGVKPSWEFYKFTDFLYPILKKLPKYVCTTEEVGLAMINAVIKGASVSALESKDIVALAR